MISRRSYVAVCVALAAGCMLDGGLRGAEITAGHGLALRLDDRTGAVTGIAAGQRALPLLEGQVGGLAVREWQLVRVPAAAEPLASVDFETAQGWRSSAGVSLEPGAAVAVEPRRDGGAGGSEGYARLGVNQKYGHGVRLERDLPVSAGRDYVISWQGRVPALEATYIVYVQAFDAAGRDVTTASPAPKGWQYSPSSKTHYQYLIAASRPAAWERFSRPYRVTENVSTLRVAVCLWRGAYVDLDDLRVEEAGSGAVPGELAVLAGPVACRPDGQSALQHAVISERQLEVSLTYASGPTGIRVTVELRDLSNPPRERALEVSYRLPLQTAGWVWHDDIRRQRRIEAGTTFSNDFSYEGHLVSRYPFSCITDATSGLMLGMPQDCPAMEWRSCRADSGFVHTLKVGLSPLTEQIGAGRASWSFVISAIEPGWGFRAAAATYYEMFPGFFANRAQREGTWLWPVPPHQIPSPEDFGLTFWETHSEDKDSGAVARQKGIYVMHYIEPSGLRQWFPEVKGSTPMFSPDECLARLQKLAAAVGSSRKWSGGPEAEMAQAVLNSLPELADGGTPSQAENEYDAWARWWYTNPSPYLPTPNRGGACWTYEISPHLAAADGVYVDSVGLCLATGFMNCRTPHLSAARTLLSFDRDTLRPCLPAVSSYHDFLAWLATELRARDKLLMLNLGADPPAYRFFGHTGDVLGSETGSNGNVARRRLCEVESDEVSCLRRTYAFRKPTTNLLQEGNFHSPAPAVTRGEVEQYIKHQMFYGFYPAISTLGGEEKPGYANWKRYFSSPEQYERDRDLFKQYIPVIRRLNAAGWEPLTYATTSMDTVFIERYGAWDRTGLYLSLRNSGDQEASFTVAVQAFALGLELTPPERVVVREVVSGAVIAAKRGGAAGGLEFALSLPPRDTAVIALERAPER